MPWNLLLLPLIGGYFLISRSNYFKYRHQRLDKQQLVFDSALVGLIIAISLFILKIILYSLFPNLQVVLNALNPIKIPYSGTAFVIFTFCIFVTMLGNLTFFRNYKKFIKKAIKSVGSEYELLLESSYSNSKLIEISLNSDKFYIGWVKELPIPRFSNQIRLIPVFSGYRNQEKRLIFTTQYLGVYTETIDEKNINDFKELDVDLVIGIENVISISYFDVEMYDKFNSLET